MQFLRTETVSSPDLNLLTTYSNSKLLIFLVRGAANKMILGSRAVGTKLFFLLKEGSL